VRTKSRSKTKGRREEGGEKIKKKDKRKEGKKRKKQNFNFFNPRFFCENCLKLAFLVKNHL
jgi:hypothetical protein